MTGELGLTNVRVDIIVRGLELALRHRRQVTRVGNDNTSDGCIIGVHECREVTRRD